MEILYNGTWGTVCDDSWDIRDARVVCRQLGFDRAIQAVSNAQFGPGTGTIWLDDVACFGNEVTLAECLASPIGHHNCRHYEDAGVRCYCKLVHVLPFVLLFSSWVGSLVLIYLSLSLSPSLLLSHTPPQHLILRFALWMETLAS